MGRRIARNLIIIGIGLFLYVMYVVMVGHFGLDVWILLGSYALLGGLAYFLNRKRIWALRGNYLYVTGNTARARVALKKAVDSGVKSTSAYLYYALLLVKEDNNATDAFKYLEKAKEYAKNPVDQRSALITIATCHYMDGNLEAGIKTLEDMRKEHEYTNTSALVTLGYLHLKAGDYEKALEATNSAIEEEGDYASAWDNLGQIYYETGDVDKARNAFEQALRHKSSLADSNYFMGLICEAEGEHEMAKDYFRMASISPFGIFNSITQEMADEKYEEYHGKSE